MSGTTIVVEFPNGKKVTKEVELNLTMEWLDADDLANDLFFSDKYAEDMNSGMPEMTLEHKDMIVPVRFEEVTGSLYLSKTSLNKLNGIHPVKP